MHGVGHPFLTPTLVSINRAFPLEGTLNGLDHALQRDGFSVPGKSAYTPMKLNLPTAIRAIRQAAACPTTCIVLTHPLTAVEGYTPPASTTS